jgi:hypothetical protein
VGGGYQCIVLLTGIVGKGSWSEGDKEEVGEVGDGWSVGWGEWGGYEHLVEVGKEWRRLELEEVEKEEVSEVVFLGARLMM